jgi:uncharacterized protein (UPF0333 family)
LVTRWIRGFWPVLHFTPKRPKDRLLLFFSPSLLVRIFGRIPLVHGDATLLSAPRREGRMGSGARKGQIAMEYLLAVGFAFLLLVPIIIIAYTQSSRFSDDVTAAQVQRVGEELVEAVHAVHYAGPPAKKTVRVYFPERVSDVSFQNSTIVFSIQAEGGAYEYAVFSQAVLSGDVREFAGVHVITVEATGGGVNVTDG